MADLVVTLTETLTLNSDSYDNSNAITIGSIVEIDKRVVTITTNEATIATFSGTVGSAGHYNDGNVRYMRFTNKDDTNFITLTFRNQDNDEVAIRLDAGNSFMWSADNSGGMVDVFNATQAADSASDTVLASLTTIQADANTGSCDLEMIIASV